MHRATPILPCLDAGVSQSGYKQTSISRKTHAFPRNARGLRLRRAQELGDGPDAPGPSHPVTWPPGHMPTGSVGPSSGRQCRTVPKCQVGRGTCWHPPASSVLIHPRLRAKVPTGLGTPSHSRASLGPLWASLPTCQLPNRVVAWPSTVAHPPATPATSPPTMASLARARARGAGGIWGFSPDERPAICVCETDEGGRPTFPGQPACEASLRAPPGVRVSAHATAPHPSGAVVPLPSRATEAATDLPGRVRWGYQVLCIR